jgi:alpha,alpha-trehalase
MSSGLQWDMPNAWPPLQFSTIKAIQFALGQASDCPSNQREWLQTMLHRVAQTFINAAYCGWKSTGGILFQKEHLEHQAGVEQPGQGHLFEKFHAIKVGESGYGGEYEPQEGFGWTNGIVIWTLNEFGHVLELPSCPTQAKLLSAATSSLSNHWIIALLWISIYLFI